MTSLLLPAVAMAFVKPPLRLEVMGDVTKRRSFSVEELAQTFAGETKEVAFTEKGVAGRAHAFPLSALLQASSPKIDAQRKHAQFSLAVVAIADDGYSAVFSGAELSAELGKGDVWVAIDWNDKPLTGSDAPVRLIVRGDAKPSRWVHGVRTLRIVNLASKGRGPVPETKTP